MPHLTDAKNGLATAGGVTYTYDGDGKRVKKSNGTLYWTGPGWDPLVETDLSGNVTEQYVFFNGERVARVDLPAGTVEYYFSDHLKSTDIVTNATGGIVRESDYVPYGSEVTISGTDPNRYKFTGKERDLESGLDNFDARFYSSPFGRFMTPDWEAKPTSVPYANFGNPQSLNLYSYVQNNPTTVGDPDGHGDEATLALTASSQVFGPEVGIPVLLLVGSYEAYLHRDEIAQSVQNIRESIFHSEDSSKNTPPPPTSNTSESGKAVPSPDSSKDQKGNTSRTEHGEQRAAEAKAGDTHRQVGDANRTVQQGRTFTDTKTGNNVNVRGNKVVITDSKGNIVSQFKNSRANTLKRIKSGRWKSQ